MKEVREKATISMKKELMEKVQEFADTLGITRSSAVSVLVSQAFEYKYMVDMANKLPDMLQTLDDMQKRQQEKEFLEVLKKREAEQSG